MKCEIDVNILKLVEMCKVYESPFIRDAGFICEIKNMDGFKYVIIQNENFPLWALGFNISNENYDRKYIGENTIDNLENKGILFGKDVLMRGINDFFFNSFVPYAFSEFTLGKIESKVVFKQSFVNTLIQMKIDEKHTLDYDLNILKIDKGSFRFYNHADTISLYIDVNEDGKLFTSIGNFAKCLIKHEES